MEALPQDLADFLVTRNFDPEYFDDKGQPAEAGDAKTMKFDYVASSGKNYGTAVCVLADNELSLFYGDNLGRGMEQEDKQDWFSFLEQLSNTAASHSATWSPRDINQLKHTLAGIAAIKEGLFEGYYGTRKISYMGEQTQARLVIKHNRVLGEDDKRYRYVESLFIETAEQERFRLPFKSLSAGRAMLEHVRSGGNPYDVRGNHITEIVGEMAVLSRFNRAQHNRVFEGVTQELVESARQYYHNLQETVRHLGSPRGYQAYFESWAPDQTGEAEALVENLRDMFVEQTLDARIEAALPTLAKIQQQGNNMKEAEIFESWINQLSEGTWALPDTPESQEKLNQLMSAELIVGPDATNATELLYDIVGDDELFDILNDLADKSQGRANIWDDSDVQRRLAELGVQTPQSTQAEPANVAQDTAPVAPPVAEGEDGVPRQPAVQIINDFDEVVSVFDHMPKGLRRHLRSSEFDAVQWLADVTKRDPEFDITTIEKIVIAPNVYGPEEYTIDVQQYLDDLDLNENRGLAEDSRMRDFSRQDQLDHEDEIDSRAFNRLQNRITRQRGSHSAGVDIERWLKPYQILSKNNLKPKETGDRFEYLMQVALKLKGTDAGFDNSTGMSNAYKIFNLDHSEQKLIAQLMRSAPKTSELEKYLRNSQFEDVHAKTDDKLLAYYAQIKAEKEQQKKEQGVAEGGEKDRQWSNKDMERLRRAETELDDIFGTPDDSWTKTKQSQIKKRIQTKPMAGPKDVLPEQGVAEGDNMSTFVEDRELAEMLKYAGVPIKENVLTDSTGSTLDHILDTYKRDVKDFTQSGEMSRHLEQVLYDYYYDDMPYGAKTGEDIDTSEWIGDRFAQDIGLDEGWKGALTGAALGGALGSIVPGLGTIQGAIAGGYAGHRLGDEGLANPDKEYNARQKLQTQQPKPVSECNYTMEGEYCPEHGLMECGMADGGAVGMPYSMGEAQAPQDPMNSNSAMTGSYYEGKESKSQEGDALLARIKSLALLR